MDSPVYPPPSLELSTERQKLAPETEKAFRAFSKQVFADGALKAKTKQIIAVADPELGKRVEAERAARRKKVLDSDAEVRGKTGA